MKGRDDSRVLIDWRKNDGEGGSGALYVKSVGHRRNFYDRDA